jgi:predicted amidophosphoribosyltransferase
MPTAPELSLVAPGICPQCGQRVTTPGRICAACCKPILRHHKYVFVAGQVRHRCCENPTSYTKAEKA